jgi:hypothetical protein
VALEGFMWKKGDTAVLLEGSINKSERRAEFIRLRFASIAAAKNTPRTMARRGSFAENVKKDDKGFTWIDSVPMVDQGQKGYCVVASIERVARYFGAEMDQHEMAQLANSDEDGTHGDEMEKAFQKVTGKIHLRTLKHIEFSERQMEKDIRSYNSAAKKAGVKTFAQLAFFSGYLPGGSEEAFNESLVAPLLGTRDHAQCPGLRRIFAETYTFSAADLQRRVGPRTDLSSAPLPSAEREARLRSLLGRLPGLRMTSAYEPSHRALDLAHELVQVVHVADH